MKRFSYGEGIRIARKKFGMTLEKLANKIGISRRYLTQIETHDRSPSDKVFRKIKDALDLSTDLERDYLKDKHPTSPIISPVKSDFLSREQIEKLRKEIVALDINSKQKQKLQRLLTPKKSK